jgi:tetratricopeptide (TPR) repeat protein
VHVLLLGGSPDDRRRLAQTYVSATHAAVHLDSRTLPFVRVGEVALPPPPRALLVHDIDRAFPDHQTGGTRLVLTQSTYLLQKWIDRAEPGDRLIATADRAALEQGAPEALHGRGPWGAFEIVELKDFNTKDTNDTKERAGTPDHSSVSLVSSGLKNDLLASAYASSSPDERLRLCREAVALAPESAVAWLALASARRERRDLASRDALERAAALAPDWEAVPYEAGKLWLALDDMARARDAFARAGSLMPAFSAAFSNLGATLGELDEPERALAAFEQALVHDPRGVQILNNIGVVNRELGRLDASEQALRQVVEIAPAFVFGHYNLGHTLFLNGRYPQALAAYEEGRRRDPEQSRRQGCRLAVMRLANGDLAGAERDLWRYAGAAPADEREDLLLEAYESVQALIAHDPARAADAAHAAFLDRLGWQIAKSE